jgi:hypothetical protein
LPVAIVLNGGAATMAKNKHLRKYIGQMAEESERLEGLMEIAKFIDPDMSRRTFYRHHREALRPYLLERRDAWKYRKPRYFSYKRLILLYMLRRRVI